MVFRMPPNLQVPLQKVKKVKRIQIGLVILAEDEKMQM